ncbi:MAG: hypothetical protein AAFO04_11965 [Cyanobacteria bacterium J06592_8]
MNEDEKKSNQDNPNPEEPSQSRGDPGRTDRGPSQPTPRSPGKVDRGPTSDEKIEPDDPGRTDRGPS